MDGLHQVGADAAGRQVHLQVAAGAFAEHAVRGAAEQRAHGRQQHHVRLRQRGAGKAAGEEMGQAFVQQAHAAGQEAVRHFMELHGAQPVRITGRQRGQAQHGQAGEACHGQVQVARLGPALQQDARRRQAEELAALCDGILEISLHGRRQDRLAQHPQGAALAPRLAAGDHVQQQRIGMEPSAQSEQGVERGQRRVALARRGQPQHIAGALPQGGRRGDAGGGALAARLEHAERVIVHGAGASAASRPSSMTDTTVSVTPSISSKAASSSS